MKRTPAPRPGTRGYTLIELIIIVVLLGVVLTVVAPSMVGTISASRTDGAINRLTSDLMMARMEAVRSGRRVDFVVNGSGTQYAVVRRRATTAAMDTIRRVNLLREFPGVTVSPGMTLIFDSRGLVTGSSANSIVEARRGNETRRITVSPIGTVSRAN